MQNVNRRWTTCEAEWRNWRRGLGNPLVRERKKARAGENLHIKAIAFAEVGSSGDTLE